LATQNEQVKAQNAAQMEIANDNVVAARNRVVANNAKLDKANEVFEQMTKAVQDMANKVEAHTPKVEADARFKENKRIDALPELDAVKAKSVVQAAQGTPNATLV
jgi:hypothetical protein